MDTPTTSRTRRWTTAVLSLTMVLALFPAATASAQEWSGVGSGSSGGSSSNGGGGSTVCTSQFAGATGGSVRYMRPYPGCGRYGSRSRTSSTPRVGPVGIEVWRFYGENTSGRHVRAWTVSEAVLPYWGMQDNAAYALFVPHPADANGRLNGGRSWGPWVIESGRVVNDWERVQTWARSSTQNRLTTSAPFRTSSRKCTDLQNSSDPLAPYFTRGTEEYAGGAQVRNALYQSFRHWRRDEGVSVPSALSSINSSGSRANGVGQSPTGPDDIRYGDNLDCSSSLDFVRTTNQTPVLFGVCWVPTEARYYPFSGSTGPYSRGFTTAGSVRYVPMPRQGGFAEYRQAIYDEVRSRTRSSTRPLPAQPYVRNNGQPVLSINEPARNATAAATAASTSARCTRGLGSMWSEDEKTTKGQNPNGVTVTVTTPNVINVGGKTRPVDITATSNGLRCGSGPCTGASAPRLISLDYTLRATSNSSSYTTCSTTGRVPLGCDLNVVDRGKTIGGSAFTGPDGVRYNPRLTERHRLTLEGYRATTGSERVRVQVTGASARYVTFDVETRTLCVTGVESRFGGNSTTGDASKPCDSSAPVTTVKARTGSVPVTVQGTRDIPVVGGNLRVEEARMR